MHKITDKIATSLQKLQSPKAPSVPHVTHPPLETSIYRFRKQRGVNLGGHNGASSWFVLERWITDAPFRHAAPPAQSDLDVARGPNAASILEAHYAAWITDADFAWLAERGFTAVRIPIGYYHLCGADPSVLAGTDFAEFGDVFRGAWARIINAIETAQRFGLGVLLDLHAAPGKQNNDAHAGTSGPAAFFSDQRHRAHTIHVLRTLVTHLTAHTPPLVNLIGIELLNEPHPSSDAELKKWYSAVIAALAALDPTLPIYLSDCWKTDEYAEYIKSAVPHGPLLVLDHHLYRCFTPADIATPAPAHARALTDAGAPTPRLFARVADTLDAAAVGAGLVVGEWSGALNPGSLTGAPDDADAKAFVAAQLALYEAAHCAGHFFWTYKKETQGGKGVDRGWCLRDAVAGGVYPAPLGLRASKTKSPAGDEERRARVRDGLRDKALGAHVAYWSQFPGKYNHARFGEGFALGWDDAYIFFTSSHAGGGGGGNVAVSELGFVGAWAKTRTDDHGSNFWEFLHGFKQGAAAARSDFQGNYCAE